MADKPSMDEPPCLEHLPQLSHLITSPLAHPLGSVMKNRTLAAAVLVDVDMQDAARNTSGRGA